MTTDIATQPSGREVAAFAPTPSEAVHAALEQWVGGMAASVRGAEYIVDTPMCPDSFWPVPAGVSSKTPKQLLPRETLEDYRARRYVAACTLGAVVRYGLQLGLPPEVAVQGIFTIGGRMSMYAEQMVALVRSQGHGHRVVERTRQRCIVEVCRRGSDDWHRFEFTLDDAVQAGYVPDQGPNAGDHGKWPDGNAKKSPGNAKYLTDPAAMLYARCSSIACRTEFPDVLRGLTSYEDMLDERVTVTVADDEPTRADVRRDADRTSAAAILARAAEPSAPLANGGFVGAPGLVMVAEHGPDLVVPNHATSSVEASAAPQATAAPPVQVQRMVLPVSKPQLDLIKAAFERHDLGGRAASVRAARMRVLSVLVGREIDDPRSLTGDEARLVLDHIGTDDGARVIADILATYSVLPAQEPPVDSVVGDEGYDPTVEAGWARDEGAGQDG